MQLVNSLVSRGANINAFMNPEENGILWSPNRFQEVVGISVSLYVPLAISALNGCD